MAITEKMKLATPVTDQVGDFLTRIRNAALAKHDQVVIPASRVRLELAKLLKSEGFIQKYDVLEYKGRGQIRITLKYGPNREPVITGLRRISRPGLRVYSAWKEIPRVMGGLGVPLVSTSRGILADREARRRHVGGEVLCQVW